MTMICNRATTCLYLIAPDVPNDMLVVDKMGPGIMVQGRWPPQPLDEWFGTTPQNEDVVNALCDRSKRMPYGALKEIDNGGVARSPLLFGRQPQGLGGCGGVAQQRVCARAPMVVEQSPRSGSTCQMLGFTNAESPLGCRSESFEEFPESLNKFMEEEGTSGEARGDNTTSGDNATSGEDTTGGDGDAKPMPSGDIARSSSAAVLVPTQGTPHLWDPK